MDTDINFSVARGNGAVPAKRPAAATKPSSKPAANSRLRTLQDRLDATPDARPGAVERARALIADAGFPSEEQEQAIANHLASQWMGQNEAGF